MVCYTVIVPSYQRNIITEKEQLLKRLATDVKSWLPRLEQS